MINMKIGQPCSGSYEVITEDAAPITVRVTGPDAVVHYESNGAEADAKDSTPDEEKPDGEEEEPVSLGDAFQFDADFDGMYTMCFFNDETKSDDGLSRVIAFNFRASDAKQRDDYAYNGIGSELESLQRGLDELKDHQSYMSQREDIHKSTLNSINFKVLCWTVLESVILILTAIWQISYISSFFETKRRL